MSSENLLKRVTAASVSITLILIAIKLYVVARSPAMSVQASLADSLSDFLTSSLNFLALRYSLKPADDEHRFGHGKAEALMSLIQGIILLQIAAFLVYKAFSHEEILEKSLDVTSIVLTVVCIILTFGLVLFQRSVLKKTKSLIVSADSLHYEGDLLINGGVLVSLWFFSYGWLDQVITMLIVGYILYGTAQILKQAFDVLMDRELGIDIHEKILSITKDHEHILGIHALKTRSAGHNTFIQLHIDLDPNLKLVDAHEIADKLEKDIEAKIPNSQVMTHQDPFGVEHQYE